VVLGARAIVSSRSFPSGAVIGVEVKTATGVSSSVRELQFILVVRRIPRTTRKDVIPVLRALLSRHCHRRGALRATAFEWRRTWCDLCT